MNVTFDISDDELQIFMAEAEEHLQRLDEGLLRLEREGGDAELLQEIFRAAHTLKGSAGMIGHQRMAELTHAMETVLDGVRKHTVEVSAPLVDACVSRTATRVPGTNRRDRLVRSAGIPSHRPDAPGSE